MVASDLLLSLCGSVAITFAFALASADFQHWFVVPVTICGALIGADAVGWFRGRLDVFDPVGVIGILGVHFFFLAPLLHVYWDSWLLYVVPPNDWRDWLGKMACFNIVGILAYLFSRRLYLQKRGSIEQARIWCLDLARFNRLLIPALFITGLLQVYVYATSGGIAGYIYSAANETGAFQGKGFLFMFSESFPILAFFGFAVWARGKKFSKSWLLLFGVLLFYFVLKILFGGLRGSRSNTIWGIMWAVGVLHLWVRPIPKKYIGFGLAFLFAFMYLYGFFKSYGVDALDIIQSPELRQQKSEQSGRTFEATLLGDLGRSDIQAYVLYELWPDERDNDFNYAHGRTYIGAMTLLIPSSIWPTRPATKTQPGTELIVGRGAYAQGYRASRVYGLAGEAMLNFGVFSIPLVFIGLGAAVAIVRRWFLSWQHGDARILLIPFLVNLCFLIMTADSDGVVFFAVKNGLVPFALIALAAKPSAQSLLQTHGRPNIAS